MEMHSQLQCSNDPDSLVGTEQISRTFSVPYALNLQIQRQTNDTRQKVLALIAEDLEFKPWCYIYQLYDVAQVILSSSLHNAIP